MSDVNWTDLRDDDGEPARLKKRERLSRALDEAYKLIDEGWTYDDCHTGIVYLRGTGPSKRVSVETYMFIQAIFGGIGTAVLRERERALLP